MQAKRDVEALKAEWVSLEAMLADIELERFLMVLAIPSRSATAKPLFGAESEKLNRHLGVVAQLIPDVLVLKFSPALFKLAHYPAPSLRVPNRPSADPDG